MRCGKNPSAKQCRRRMDAGGRRGWATRQEEGKPRRPSQPGRVRARGRKGWLGVAMAGCVHGVGSVESDKTNGAMLTGSSVLVNHRADASSAVSSDNACAHGASTLSASIGSARVTPRLTTATGLPI